MKNKFLLMFYVNYDIFFRYVVSYKNPAEVVRLTELSYSHVVAMDQVIHKTPKKLDVSQ